MNNKRAIYLLVVFGVMFLTLIGYLTYIEIFYAREYTESIYNPRNYELDRKIVRGSIYDKNGTELAFSEKITEEHKEIIDGTESIQTINRIVRRYPYNELYSHVIGYISDDYSSRSMIEAEYNSELLESGIMSKITDELQYGEKRGKDIFLTIDHNIQKIASDAMGNYNGAIIAMNPKSGEIIAMVSKPGFNPDPNKLDIDKLEDGALYSRATQVPYPPGSTYKIITSVAMIENGFSDEIYNDNNGKFIIKSSDGNPKNDYVCRNAGGSVYGQTTLESGFKYSSNVYFANAGSVMKTDVLQKTAEKFLFNKDINKELGFDLPIANSHFQEGSMTEAERAMASIGQGQTEATALHIALIGATIANNGVMPRPYLISKIGAENKLPFTNPGKKIISVETANKIKDMMLDVVKSGTGTAATIAGIDVCGKTGTSENTVTDKGGSDSGKTHAMFVGFAPYDNPEIAVCVVMEYAGYGGSKAAPAAKKVMEAYLSARQ